MNSYQKEVAMASLKDEAKILSELEKTYKEARKRIKDHVKDLTSREAFATESELRSIIYQKKYQNALDSQLKTILDDLKNNNYSSVNDYLEGSYRNGFMGSMYSLNKQGVPLILPINQSKVVKAITQDTKLSTSFYKKLGINMKSMKTAVRQEISRGISSGMSFDDIARNIDNRMNVGLHNTQRIARTEGHRVNMEAKFDCMKEAEKNGAEILKQWDSTLDNRTRPDHMKLDGQIRKLDEPFEVVGADGKVHKAMYPSQFGEPSEDINCRCVVLEIGKWELDEGNTKATKYEDTKGIIEIDQTKSFQEYCSKYNEKLSNVLESNGTTNIQTTKPIEKSKVRSALEMSNVEYKDVSIMKNRITEEEIISKLGGADKTKGSCSSLAFAYCGNKNGYDTTDFRGGCSQEFFCRNENIASIAKLPNVKSDIVEVMSEIDGTWDLLQKIDVGKEYYLATGQHASIVRRTDDSHFQYLELQDYPSSNGFFGLSKFTLKNRFGCTKSRKIYGVKVPSRVIMIECDSFKDNEEFRKILGYINTDSDKQKKGIGGGRK